MACTKTFTKVLYRFVKICAPTVCNQIYGVFVIEHQQLRLLIDRRTIYLLFNSR